MLLRPWRRAEPKVDVETVSKNVEELYVLVASMYDTVVPMITRKTPLRNLGMAALLGASARNVLGKDKALALFALLHADSDEVGSNTTTIDEVDPDDLAMLFTGKPAPKGDA